MNTPSHWFETGDKVSGAWEAEPELGSFGRLWRVFMTARVAIAAVLVILQAVIYAWATSPTAGPSGSASPTCAPRWPCGCGPGRGRRAAPSTRNGY
jgi:hypothetical protein